MEIKIVNEKQNDLFNRKEIDGVINSNTTPSNDEVLKILTEKFKVPEENIKIKGIYGRFGSHNFEIVANVYSTSEERNKTEQKTKQEKEAEKKAEEERVKADAEAKDAAKATPEGVHPGGASSSSSPSEEGKEEEKPAEAPKEEEKPAENKVEEKKE